MSPKVVFSLSLVVFILAGGGATYLKGRAAGIAKEAPKLAVAERKAATAMLAVKGAHESAIRSEAVRTTQADAEAISAAAAFDLSRSGDANAPVDQVWADRLRRADIELCKLANLNGCAAAH